MKAISGKNEKMFVAWFYNCEGFSALDKPTTTYFSVFVVCAGVACHVVSFVVESVN